LGPGAKYIVRRAEEPDTTSSHGAKDVEPDVYDALAKIERALNPNP